MPLKFLRYLLPVCLSLMIMGCGSLKVDSPKQDKKHNFLQMWDLINTPKREVKENDLNQ